VNVNVGVAIVVFENKIVPGGEGCPASVIRDGRIFTPIKLLLTGGID
jgi:hypothetical protein